LYYYTGWHECQLHGAPGWFVAPRSAPEESQFQKRCLDVETKNSLPML
jgi:hypothetical protein